MPFHCHQGVFRLCVHPVCVQILSLISTRFTFTAVLWDVQEQGRPRYAVPYHSVQTTTQIALLQFINTATDSHLAVGSALTSRTQSIQLSRPVQFGSRRVVLIDTPGLDDTSRSTEDVIRMVTAYVANM